MTGAPPPPAGSSFDVLAGAAFEDKWFRSPARVDQGALEASDFSAAVDLAGYASNVYDIRVTLAELKSFVALAAATAVPLLPVALFAWPFDFMFRSLAGLPF